MAQRARKGLGWEAMCLREASLCQILREPQSSYLACAPSSELALPSQHPAVPTMCNKATHGGGKKARLDTSERFAEN